MSEYLCEVFLGNVNFTQNTPHRYLNISGHFNIKSAISKARMITNNTIALPIQYITVSNYNYGYYQIEPDGKKFWFFINGFEYINDTVTNIYISVDWISTDIGNITFGKSFVSRMHPRFTDTMQTNTLEPVGNNEPLTTTYKDTYELTYNNDYYIIATTHGIPTNRDISNDFIDGELLDNINPLQLKGIYSPIPQKFYCGNMDFSYVLVNGLDSVNNYIKNALSRGYQTACGGVWRVPDFFGNAPTTPYTIEIGGEWVSGGYSQQYNLLLPTDSVSPLTSFTFENITNVDGYTPKYKKCLSYQYINPSIILNNQVITFNKNMFNNPEKMIINVNYELKGDSNLYIVPYQYEGSNQENYTHCISTKLSNAVQISADNSVYIKSNVGHILQNTMPKISGDIVEVTSGIIQVAFGLLTKTISSQVQGDANILEGLKEGTQTIIDDIPNTISKLYDIKNQSKGVTLTGGTGNTDISILPQYNKNIHSALVSYSNSDIKKVDKYFSMYGYAYNELITPYIRDTYSFIQGDITILGDINNISYNEIRNAFQNGLTIWNNTEMYNYDVE